MASLKQGLWNERKDNIWYHALYVSCMNWLGYVFVNHGFDVIDLPSSARGWSFLHASPDHVQVLVFGRLAENSQCFAEPFLADHTTLDSAIVVSIE